MKESNNLSKQVINDSSKAMVVQKDIIENAEKVIGRAKKDLDELGLLNVAHGESLDKMLMRAEKLFASQQSNSYDESFLNPLTMEFNRLEETEYEQLESISYRDEDSWEMYLTKVDSYVRLNKMSLNEDPFEQLLTKQEQAELIRKIQEDYKMEKPNCDKFDYAIASCCGVISGLIDSFFVGMPGESRLGAWTDEKVDTTVIGFAKVIWKSDKKNGAKLRKEPHSIASAIGYLERRYKVNYDARYEKDLNMGDATLNMRPSNHHLKSLGHSPDIIGLFFSILDQFTGKASFISDGKIIRLEPIEGKNKFELRGDNFIAKLFSGFANWLGHIMSDVAGSSGTRGHQDGRRGSGVPIPLYSLFQLCDFGSITINGQKKTFAEYSTTIFENGYDARFGATMAIPVAFNELIIRLLWSLKSKFYHKRTWTESLPVGNKPELRRMLVVGHGALCLVDVTDAGIRSAGNALLFGMRINLVAWSRFGLSALLEVRCLYNKNGINHTLLEKDVEEEWNRLFRV